MIVTRFLRHRVAVASLIVFVLIILFAIVGPFLWQWDHTIDRAIPSDRPPSWDHPFGTTRAGQDVMGQVMRGTQQTLKVGFLVALLATGIGSTWGAIAGFYRGRVDSVMMRLVESYFVVTAIAPEIMLDNNPRLFQQFQCGIDRGTTDTQFLEYHRGIEFIGIEMSDSIQYRIQDLEALTGGTIVLLHQKLRKGLNGLQFLIFGQYTVLLM